MRGLICWLASLTVAIVLTVQDQGLVDASGYEPTTAKLERTFGICLKLPTDWKEAAEGVVGPEGSVFFSYIWHPPHRGGANIFTGNYLYIIRLMLLLKDYANLAAELAAVLDSVSVRCSRGWCDVE